MSFKHNSYHSPRTAILFSGSGSTLQALLDQHEYLNILFVVSSRVKNLGLLRSQKAGIVRYSIDFKQGFSRLFELVCNSKISCLYLSGFMKVLPHQFINDFMKLSAQQKIINIHPSLLPAYKGLHAIENAFNDRAELGVSLHHVDEAIDSGKLILQNKSLNLSEVKIVQQAEAHLWQRASEQQILKRIGGLN